MVIQKMTQNKTGKKKRIDIGVTIVPQIKFNTSVIQNSGHVLKCFVCSVGLLREIKVLVGQRLNLFRRFKLIFGPKILKVLEKFC